MGPNWEPDYESFLFVYKSCFFIFDVFKVVLISMWTFYIDGGIEICSGIERFALR